MKKIRIKALAKIGNRPIENCIMFEKVPNWMCSIEDMVDKHETIMDYVNNKGIDEIIEVRSVEAI